MKQGNDKSAFDVSDDEESDEKITPARARGLRNAAIGPLAIEPEKNEFGVARGAGLGRMSSGVARRKSAPKVFRDVSESEIEESESEGKGDLGRDRRDESFSSGSEIFFLLPRCPVSFSAQPFSECLFSWGAPHTKGRVVSVINLSSRLLLLQLFYSHACSVSRANRYTEIHLQGKTRSTSPQQQRRDCQLKCEKTVSVNSQSRPAVFRTTK